MSISSLILPSYTIRATTFEKVFWLEKFPKTEFVAPSMSILRSFWIKLCPYCRPSKLGLASRQKVQLRRRVKAALRAHNMLQANIFPPPLKNAWHNNPLIFNLITPFLSRSPVLRCFFSFNPWKKSKILHWESQTKFKFINIALNRLF